jgi:galactose mutarotase-like enzyme
MAFSVIDDGSVRVEINPLGAELSSLRYDGHELLWQGGPAWPRRAPILFPIIGKMPNDSLVHDGQTYEISQHGFARDAHFDVEEVSATEVAFTLESSPWTLAKFPFAFRLEVRFSISGGRLQVQHTVSNTGADAFSASIGGHPGLAWPLLPGIAREDHSIEFPSAEPAPIRRLQDGLLLPDPVPSPVDGAVLHLGDDLFVDDAVIFDSLESRSLRYTAPGAPVIAMDFADFRELGVWSRAPGEYVCIEPWFGMTAPQGFTGDYARKPAQFRLEAGASQQFTYGIEITSSN